MIGYGGKIPVILDTDIGNDIDDTWALTMMLKCPELDVKLVATDTGNTTYRAKIVAKMLEVSGKVDIPVGIGLQFGEKTGPQKSWVEGYELSDYPGPLHKDGVGAIIDTVLSSLEPITLICIGPVPNIAAALHREPRIGERTRFVGMHGCIRRSHKRGVIASSNVVRHTKECQKVFKAPWEMTITPLDTCSFVRLEGKKYHAVRDCDDPLVQALMENYRIWLTEMKRNSNLFARVRARWNEKLETRSTTLYDTVAIYLSFSEELLVMEKFGIRVTDNGYTVIDPSARIINCATEWKDLPAFEDLLVERLTRKQI